MKRIFYITVKILLLIASKFNLTYNEVNVLIWYFFIPLLWALLISVKLHNMAILSIAIIIELILVKNYKIYSNQLFKKSQTFLLWFNRFGCNYIQASVLVCIVLPIIITLFLLYI